MTLMLLLLLYHFLVCICIGQNVIKIENGFIKGGQGRTAGSHQPFYFFRGIPYAEPPVGSLRFEPTVPKSNWSGIKDATQDRPECIQSTPINGSEDCLYINVYSPKKPHERCHLLPTYIWIYGGGFRIGASDYSSFAPDFILEKNIVVVTFNYRLSYLGFLSTGDEIAPGNAGLKDQLLALKWVQKNIRFFCGDPNQVTLGGESAGAASASYHLLSSGREQLFHRVIMESGNSLSSLTLSRNVPDVTKQLASAVGVSTSSSANILQGLKKVNISVLHEKANTIYDFIWITSDLVNNGYPFGPVIEPNIPGAFVTKKSYEALVKGEFIKVPILTGFNSLEDGYAYETLKQLFASFGRDLDSINLVPIDANVTPSLQSNASSSIKEFYFGDQPISSSNVTFNIAVSDIQFVRPTWKFVQLTKSRVPIYFYRFSYEGGLTRINRTLYPGVIHAEELAYYWKYPDPPTSPQDLIVRQRFVTLLTNFIKFGNPTPVRSLALQNKIWPRSGPNIDYLDIGHDLVNAQKPENDRMEFWENFYSLYGNPPYDTY